MFDLKNKKTRFRFMGMLISLAIMLIVFFATDDWLGDKEFSEYTRNDWLIAILPLIIIVISAVSCLVFSLMILIPLFRIHGSLMEYIRYKKFSETGFETEFFVFDHHELKRACCRREGQSGLWFSVAEYDLKARRWTILEEGRFIENEDDLSNILKKDYEYDKVKFYRASNHLL